MAVSAGLETKMIQHLYHGLPAAPPAVPVCVTQSGGGPPGGTLATASAHKRWRSLRSVSVACLTSSGVRGVSPRPRGSANSDGYVLEDDDEQADSSAATAITAAAAPSRLRVLRANAIQACSPALTPPRRGPSPPHPYGVGRPLARLVPLNCLPIQYLRQPIERAPKVLSSWLICPNEDAGMGAPFRTYRSGRRIGPDYCLPSCARQFEKPFLQKEPGWIFPLGR